MLKGMVGALSHVICRGGCGIEVLSKSPPKLRIYTGTRVKMSDLADLRYFTAPGPAGGRFGYPKLLF